MPFVFIIAELSLIDRVLSVREECSELLLGYEFDSYLESVGLEALHHARNLLLPDIVGIRFIRPLDSPSGNLRISVWIDRLREVVVLIVLVADRDFDAELGIDLLDILRRSGGGHPSRGRHRPHYR